MNLLIDLLYYALVLLVPHNLERDDLAGRFARLMHFGAVCDGEAAIAQLAAGVVVVTALWLANDRRRRICEHRHLVFVEAAFREGKEAMWWVHRGKLGAAVFGSVNNRC